MIGEPKRSRLEDLGRICEMLNSLVDDPIWFQPRSDHVHCKRAEEKKESPNVDRCWDEFYIDGHLNALDEIKGRILEIWSLARWGDQEAL